MSDEADQSSQRSDPEVENIDEDEGSNPGIEDIDELKIKFDRTPSYKVYHTDGVHGGITPQSDLLLNFYSEEQPIPDKSIHSVEEGRMSEPQNVYESDVDIIRHVEGGLAMDMDTAISLWQWLGGNLRHAVEIGEIEEERAVELGLIDPVSNGN